MFRGKQTWNEKQKYRIRKKNGWRQLLTIVVLMLFTVILIVLFAKLILPYVCLPPLSRDCMNLK
jgi:hypothetical protein